MTVQGVNATLPTPRVHGAGPQGAKAARANFPACRTACAQHRKAPAPAPGGQAGVGVLPCNADAQYPVSGVGRASTGIVENLVTP